MPGWLHRYLTDGLAEACPEGTLVLREHPIRVGDRTLFADLVVKRDERTGVVEVETFSADRVPADVEKAHATGADFLLIATPDRRTADAVKRALRRGRRRITQRGLRIVVAPYAAAITALRELLTLDDFLVVPTVNKSTTTPAQLPTTHEPPLSPREE